MDIVSIIIIIIIGIISVLTFYIIGIYNKLLDAKNKVEAKFIQIDKEIKKKISLTIKLEKTIAKDIKHEEKLLTKLVTIAKELENEKEINNIIKYFKELNKSLEKTLNLEETYIDLKNNKSFIKIKKDLKECDEKIEYASAFYNDRVEEYNVLIKETQNKIIAKLFKFIEIKQL